MSFLPSLSSMPFIGNFFTPWWQRPLNGMNDAEKDIIWTNDLECTQLAFELLSLGPIAGEHGLQLTNLTKRIGATDSDPRLITRASARELCRAVIDYLLSAEGRKAIIEGPIGIGKSRTMLHLLLLCMQANLLIIYDDSESQRTYVFVPEKKVLGHRPVEGSHSPLDALATDPHRYTVFCCRTEKRNRGAALMRFSAVYLFDHSPGSIEPPELPCRVVLVGSPGKKRFAQMHQSGFARVYRMNPYEDNEVVEFFRLLRNPVDQIYHRFTTEYLTQDRIRAGYEDVGGSIAALSSEADLAEAIAIQERAIHALSYEQIERLWELHGHRQNLLGVGEGYYTSAILYYRNNAPPANYQEHSDPSNTFTAPISANIMLRIAATHYSQLYARMEDGAMIGRNVLEQLGILALTVGGRFFVKCLSTGAPAPKGHYVLHLPRATSHAVVGDLDASRAALAVCPAGLVAPFISTITTVTPAVGCPHVTFSLPAGVVPVRGMRGTGVGAGPNPNSALPAARNVVHSDSPIRSVVDVADYRNRGFKLTTSTSHPVNLNKFFQSLVALNITQEDPFHLFFVTPASTYAKFNRVQKYTCDDSTAAATLANNENRTHVHPRVVQWVMQLPRELPGAQDYVY